MMKPFSLVLCGILCLLLAVFSCAKEKSFEDPASKGSLQSDLTGDCLPSTIAGTYYADSALVDTANYMGLTAEITKTGTYSISSDTVDGIYFKGEGNINQLGTVVLTAAGHGKPVAAGTFTFHVTYGTTTCSKEITVNPGASGGGTTSVYTFETIAGDCPTPVFAGTYMAGIALNATNTLTFDVHVTTPGTYSFTLPAGSDISFTGSGNFSDTGSHTVTLTGSGTPQTEGDVTITAGNCSFPLTIASNNLPDAVLAPDCATVKANGTYQAGTGMGPGNTLTLSATVSTAGKWNIQTDEVNGVTFYNSGTFATASVTPQTITLAGSGTPEAAGEFTYTLSGNGVTCSFKVTFAAAPAPAVFTLAGAPNACTSATVNGTYTAATATNNSNTVTVSVSVTSVGIYSIVTDVVNGISFSSSGSFTQTGTQVVTLQASGTPVIGGVNTFHLQTTSSCSFDVTVADAPPVVSGTFTCKIDGVATTFNDRAQAKTEPDITLNNDPSLEMTGYAAEVNGTEIPNIGLYITKTDGIQVSTGTYDEKHFIPPGTYRIEADYEEVHADNTVTRWNTSSNFLSTNPPFTIIITSITGTRVKGTFSGKMTNLFEGSNKTITITDGVFDLPIVP